MPRVANYLTGLRHDMLRLAYACGVEHPALVTGEAIELLLEGDRGESLWSRYGYEPGWHVSSSPDTIGRLRSALAELA